MTEAARPNRRWTIGILLSTGVLVNYLDRISLSVAAPQLQLDFHLTPAQTGLLFSAFFWSYSLAQLPSGYAGIFVARLLLGIAEAPGMIGNQKATAYWFPRNERSRSTAIFDSAAKFSNVIGVPLVAFFIV